MNLTLNKQLDFTVVDLDEQFRYVIIDDFLENPEQLRQYAIEHHTQFLYPERAYPGGVLPLGADVLAPLNRFIRREMSKLFPFSRAGLRCQSQLSLTTLQPKNFSWIQRLCHTDPGWIPGKANYASLLYLFDDCELGGTAFYRWKAEAYLREMTTKQLSDPNAGLDELQKKFQFFKEPPRYMTDSNELAEQLDEVPAKFNRLVFYSGDLPHGACIRHPQRLEDNPLTGRLSLNTFVAATPA